VKRGREAMHENMMKRRGMYPDSTSGKNQH
jgi:hypothetical protein